MLRDDVLKIANDMAFMACIWIDDEGNEVNDLVKFAQLVASKQQARIEMLEMEITALEEKLSELRDMLDEKQMDDIWKAIKIEREACAVIVENADMPDGCSNNHIAEEIRARGEA